MSRIHCQTTGGTHCQASMAVRWHLMANHVESISYRWHHNGTTLTAANVGGIGAPILAVNRPMAGCGKG